MFLIFVLLNDIQLNEYKLNDKIYIEMVKDHFLELISLLLDNGMIEVIVEKKVVVVVDDKLNSSMSNPIC